MGRSVQTSSQQPHRVPAWTWAGVESLLQAKVWSRLSPAPCKPYQDIQLLVLMAGKVAVCLLDSYHREGGKNNGLLLFPCSSSKRLKRIFMCCCRPHILWPDPALSCVAVSRTRVVPGPGSASRWENRTLLPESGPNGFLEMPKGEGRLARSPASHRGSALRETPGTSQLFGFFFVISFLSKVLPSPAFRHVRRKANKALQSCARQVLRWLGGEQAARPPAVPLPEMPRSPRCGFAGGFASVAMLGRGRSAEHRFAEFLSPGSADVGVFLGFPPCCLPSVLQKIVGA